ncbi:MAG: ParB/RepB/Spo0J family partition protein [Planctomycetes bacterium]|nr:ParB/RepB/Spo0J family partition protein [Planctomycetota bacterium]
MSRERRLGRGLEALLGRPAESQTETQAETDESTTLGLVGVDDSPAVTRDDHGQSWLDVGSVVANPYQPRKKFDEAEIADLCDSIRTHGFLQPIVVRQDGDQYQIIAGERRYRAAQLANFERVPVQIREVDDRQMAELAIVENVQRKDLNALEKAASFQRYIQEYQCTQEELAQRVNVDRSTVANLIRLLELPEAVKQMVADGCITQGHARALLPLGEEHEQCQFAKQIKQESLSVRATEQLVQDFIRRSDSEPFSVVDTEGNSRPTPKPGTSHHLAQLEDQLRLTLGTKVDLRQTAKGRGRLTVHFKNNDEFERIQAILAGGVESLRDVG